MSSTQKNILFCTCSASDIIASETKQAIKCALKNCTANLLEVTELCKLATEHDSLLKRFAALDNKIVIACYPRTIKWLFHLAGADLDIGTTTFYNMREQTATEILNDLKIDAKPACCCNSSREPFPWIPWFPVIDYDHCINCDQCLDFCLFGVYERDKNGQISVTNPQNCKNNCPACSRICPKLAIIFPKYSDAPINGAEINDADPTQNNVKLDIKKLVDSDIYTTLANRKNRAKSKLFKDDHHEQALKERSNCSSKSAVSSCRCNSSLTKPSEEPDSPCDCDCDCGPESSCCEPCPTKCYKDK